MVKIPYKRIGKKIYHKKGGVWKVKQTVTSIPKAKSALRLLYGIEGGEWKPTGKKGLASASKSTRKRVARMGGKASRR